jgi:DNA-binding MarR family transcriptional regulator
MDAPEGDSATHFWYSGDPGSQAAVDVLQALRRYRVAETRMRTRTRQEMRMGENDILAVRHVIRGRQTGRFISPKDLAELLDISSASTTTLIDRLEKSGHIERRPHPTDRRALILMPTASADDDVRAALADAHERMLAVAQSLTAEERSVVVGFLDRMSGAVGA